MIFFKSSHWPIDYDINAWGLHSLSVQFIKVLFIYPFDKSINVFVRKCPSSVIEVPPSYCVFWQITIYLYSERNSIKCYLPTWVYPNLGPAGYRRVADIRPTSLNKFSWLFFLQCAAGQTRNTNIWHFVLQSLKGSWWLVEVSDFNLIYPGRNLYLNKFFSYFQTYVPFYFFIVYLNTLFRNFCRKILGVEHCSTLVI